MFWRHSAIISPSAGPAPRSSAAARCRAPCWRSATSPSASARSISCARRWPRSSLRDRLQAENAYLQAEVKNEGRFDSIVGESPALKAVLDQVDQVAPTNSSVLIIGESGTGKEAIARAIHDLSPRARPPTDQGQLGAITPALIESELFGHEKGRSPARHKQRQGTSELADGGTIFLDEVGELPLDAQVKLLRVLQEHEISRLGSESGRSKSTSVIAATNRDLVEMVEDGGFRMDLFYRLNVFPLTFAAAARTPRGHPAAGRRSCPTRPRTGPRVQSRRRRHAAADGLPLAGQHPRAAERDRTRADPGARQGGTDRPHLVNSGIGRRAARPTSAGPAVAGSPQKNWCPGG